jgi:hypothetical protein
MGLRPTKWDENPAEQRRRIFNRLRWVFDRAAGFLHPAIRRFLPQETLPMGSSVTRVNALRIESRPERNGSLCARKVPEPVVQRAVKEYVAQHTPEDVTDAMDLGQMPDLTMHNDRCDSIPGVIK